MTDAIARMRPCQNQNNGLSTSLLDEEEFGRYREPWNNLLDAARSESFFLKWEWAYTFWESIDKKDAELQVWLCHDGQQLVGIAPFYSYSTTYMKVPVRKVAFLGDRVASDYMDVIAKPGYEEICCREVLHRLRYKSPIAYDVLDLDGVCNDSNLYRYLETGRDAIKDIQLLPSFDCPRTLLDTSFDKYISGLSASTRYALRRKHRKFERESGRIIIENTDLSRNPEMLSELFDLHRKRWDALEGKTSTFSTRYRESFNNRLLQRLAEGDGFFSCMSIDNKPVSILYIFTYKNNAFFYQNGWNPLFESYGVGLLNIQQAIRHAIEAGYKSFDFLRGEEEYKYKFCGESRTAYSVLYFASRPFGKIAKILFMSKKRLKTVLIKLRNLFGQVINPNAHTIYCLQER